MRADLLTAVRATLMAALVASRIATAMCANPPAFVLPSEGSTVPPNPVLFVFSPGDSPFVAGVSFEQRRLRELWVSTVGGDSLPFVMERIASGLDDVFRLSVRASEGTQFIVHPFQNSPLRVVRTEPITVLNVEPGRERNFRWTCSYESTRVLIPSLGAPAFRVTYARDLRGLDQAAARTIIVPGYSAPRGDREPRPEIRLGHLNCSVDMFQWSGPIFIRVTALTADGREVIGRQLLRLEQPPAPESLPDLSALGPDL